MEILKNAFVWKLSKYGVLSGPYFPIFGLNTEIYGVNTWKYRPEKTPYLDTFLAVEYEYKQMWMWK